MDGCLVLLIAVDLFFGGHDRDKWEVRSSVFALGLGCAPKMNPGMTHEASRTAYCRFCACVVILYTVPSLL